MRLSLRVVVVAGALAAACGPRAPRSTAPPENAYRANNRGVALLEQFNYPDAAAAFREALSISPALGIARFNLSLALLYAQDVPGAIREATEAARLLPAAPQPAYVLGLAARAETRAADAERWFQRVATIDPDDVGTGINLGQIYVEERKYPQAITALRRVVANEPYNVTATYNLGLALVRSGQAPEGQQLITRSQALRATPYSTTYGTGYLEQGRFAEAIASTGAEPGIVDQTPSTAAFTSATIASVGAASTAASAVATIDIDGDGRLDLFTATDNSERVLHNDGGNRWTDVTAGSGVPPTLGADGAVGGDYDNDGMSDLLVLRRDGPHLYQNAGGGRFRDVTAAVRFPRVAARLTAAAFVDLDHDGDLDIVFGGDNGALLTLRNNGNGTFTDISRPARLDATGSVVAIAPTDFDNHRDIDLFVAERDGPPKLFKNLRDGTFEDVAGQVGLAAAAQANAAITATALGDVNKDDFPDFFISRADRALFAMSDGRGRFRLVAAPDAARNASAAQLLDYNDDGLLDLLTWSRDGAHLFQNIGQGWNDVTARAGFGATASSPVAMLAAADFDADGHIDVVAASLGGITLWRNSGDPRNHAVRFQLKGRVSNRSGLGAKVQLRAGSLSARIETSAATPSVAPADVVFGLGARTNADTVRVLWPSGVLQAETLGATPAPTTIEELNRKPSSCPFLFSWNGRAFEFVTDFMGGGEMGDWQSPNQYDRPDPVEYVRIRGDQLVPRDGAYEVRVTSELEEVLFVDRLRLIALTHPADVEVFPNEGLTDPPKPFLLHVVRAQRVPAHVTDEHGHDVTDRIARLDRRYPDDFDLAPFRGFAAEHTLTIDVGAAAGPAFPVLLLTGWTDYAFSSDAVAASQAGLALRPPSVEVRDAHGRWRTVVADIGFPVGRPQTIVVDLAGRLAPGEHEVRLVTNMRIYWDQILIAARAPAGSVRQTSLEPVRADLHARGFSAVVEPDGKDPESYDYSRVTKASPWKSIVGRYTREGDIRALLARSDDMFAVAAPGDELALRFDAAAAGAVPAGWTRTFLLAADGFSKEMDINSGSPDEVEPLPFHAMPRYPYDGRVHYPDTEAYRAYRDTYNTRVIARTIRPLTGTKD